jgi:hypothetical protein
MRLGFLRLRDRAHKSAPDVIRKEFEAVRLDVSILTDRPDDADRLVEDMLPEHFGANFFRLKQSTLTGIFPGGIVLFEQQRLRDYRDGVSMFYAALRQLHDDLELSRLQHDPVLLRYVNVIPAFSRTAEVFRSNVRIAAIALHEDGEHIIEGKLGPLRLVVANQRLQVTEAPCTHGICVAHPPIITPGQRITCIPGEISITIGNVE